MTDRTKISELEIEIRQLRHFWKNRISFNTSSVKKNKKAWKTVLHHRISKYCRLYSQILNYEMYMLVSHRNMISVFDMTKVKGKNAKRMDTFKFEDGNIR